MTEIINGILIKNEITKNSFGGTELMAMRMVESIDKDLLKNFNIIHSRLRHISPDKKNILVLHDLPLDPESTHLSDKKLRGRFAKIVFVSNWQLQYFNHVHGVQYNESIVMPNAIYPIKVRKKEFDGTVRLIYHTTPHRGLQILIPVFEYLCKIFPSIHLDVYSSFNIYGWDRRDALYKEIFKLCENHPKITYHGAVSNQEVREALTKSHIFAYPCIWPETSCLAAIEAMSAMNIVVCPNYSTLPETCANWATMYQWSEDHNDHGINFAKNLADAIVTVQRQSDSFIRTLRYQKAYYDKFYNWPLVRAKEWERLLKSLL